MGFVLIDRLLVLEPGQRARATKRFAPTDHIFADHFPGMAVVPGVLLTEAMGQAGGWLVAATQGFTRWPLLTMIEGAKFRRLVRPGDEVEIEAVLRVARQPDFEIAGEARVDGRRVANARLVFRTFDLGDVGAAAPAFEQWARDTFRSLGGEALIGPLPLATT